MYHFCPVTGEKLETVGDFRNLWIVLYRSSLHEYMEVGDMRFIYPLQLLSPGVLDRFLAADSKDQEKAVSLIRSVDHRTVSVMDFEHFLLGVGGD